MENTSTQITPEQKALIEVFLKTFNDIQKILQRKTKQPQEIPFSRLVRDYKRSNLNWNDDVFLEMIDPLRNSIVHEYRNEHEYLSIPLPNIVKRLEEVHSRLSSPEAVSPKYNKEVIRFKVQDKLSLVLQEIHEKSISQFPIYDENNFKGLLTENGITRWLAGQTTKGILIVAFDYVQLNEVLAIEEFKENFRFIPKSWSVMDAENAFIQNSLLEALLISDKGNKKETPMGIITRWDILKLSPRK